MNAVSSLSLDSTLIGVGVYDALTAALVEGAGFELLWVGSFEASTARRIPDVNLLTYTEVADTVRAVRAGSKLPILVDADNGYGSLENAARAAELFAAAGVDGLCIEDNAFPKRNSLYATRDRTLEDANAFCRKLRYVVGCDTGLKIVARTEALVAGLGVDEAVERLERYSQTGVDALFVQAGRMHIEQLLEVVERLRGTLPLVLAPTAAPEISAGAFFEAGVQVVLYANVVSRTVISAVSETLGRLHDVRSLPRVGDRLADLDTVFALTGADAWQGHR